MPLLALFMFAAHILVISMLSEQSDREEVIPELLSEQSDRVKVILELLSEQSDRVKVMSELGPGEVL